MSSNNKLLGNCKVKPNNFGGIETRIGLTKDDLEYLTSKLNEKGWVNITLKTSKAGKPYLEHWAGYMGGSQAGAIESAQNKGEFQRAVAADDLPF